MFARLRRTRQNPLMRDILRETSLKLSDLIYPLFVVENEGVKDEIASMPGVFRFSIDEIFIKEKIGFEYLTRKQKDEKASNLCIKAYEKLVDVDKNAIDCIVLITQNGDFKIPHTSAILQDKLNLTKNCACFDINLACSGYIYGLCAILGFMQINGFKQGLLFTCDPYSQIINDDDKNTALLFGDAASVSLINTEPIYVPKAFKFGTDGAGFEAIFCQKDRLSIA